MTTHVYTGSARGAEWGPAPRDIDAFYHRKGKGQCKGKKGKGKGKSHDGGNATWIHSQTCYNCGIPRTQRGQRIWENDDFPYYEEYGGAYDDERCEWDYGDESMSKLAEHPASISTTVDPRAAAQQLAAQGASASTHPPVATNAFASGTVPKLTTMATFAASSQGLLGNSFIMPVLTKYCHDHFATEKLLLDYGAGCCVCHRDYAPECPIEPLHSDQVPRLVTITGDPMAVYGYKYVHCTFSHGALDGGMLPCMRHSLFAGERRRTMPFGLQRQLLATTIRLCDGGITIARM